MTTAERPAPDPSKKHIFPDFRGADNFLRHYPDLEVKVRVTLDGKTFDFDRKPGSVQGAGDDR